MDKNELVGYIQGLLDMSKRSNEIILEKYRHGEDLPKIESELLELISEALEKHKNYINKGDVNYFNKKADEYSPPIKNDVDPIWNGPSEDLLEDDVDKGWVKHEQITKKPPKISNYGDFDKPEMEGC